MDALTPATGAAVVRTLRRRGVEVRFPEAQGCCGQPAWSAGFASEAARVARGTLTALEAALDDGAGSIVCPAGSCATMCRTFGPELFTLVGDGASAARARRVGAAVQEYSELLATLPAPPQQPQERRVALHASCHMLRELEIREQPGRLAAAAGYRLDEWPGAERCCGFGGTFSMALPEVSEAMADDKLRDLDADPPDVLAGCDPSCLLHLAARARARGKPIPTAHLAELLDAAESAAERTGAANDA